MIRFLLSPLMVLLLMAGSGAAHAELVVVVNPKSGVDKLSRDEVTNIFLGRFRQLPGGMAAQPIDLPTAQGEKASFYRLLVNKELAEINAYWARLVFSGRTSPPRLGGGNEDVLRYVAATPGGIGYLDRSKTDSRVRIVLELNERAD